MRLRKLKKVYLYLLPGYFFTGMIVLASLFSCGSPQRKGSTQVHESGVANDRPNVIFIMSDDHTSQAISAYGGMLGSVCPTPNIDRLAREGMLFSNCFVTNSICSPSRAAIMTGKYAHKNGVYKFTALDQRQPTLPKIMQASGYQTALIGKYHLHSNPVGLDYFEILPGQGDYHNPELIVAGDEHPSGWVAQAKMTTNRGHSSDVIADRALHYLENKVAKERPFMLFCHFKAPHDTWEYAERYEDFLEDIEIPEPSNLFDDYEGRSDALKNTLQYIGSDWGEHTNFEEQTEHLEGLGKRKKQYQLYMKKYLRCVKGVDDNVGRILDYIDQTGLAENTIIIYTGDQGFFLGEHGLYDKRFMYEEALRMPFLMRWPGKIEKGTVSDGMILNVDFAPSILDAAGLEPHPEMQGRSFIPLTEGRIPGDWRESMYYRYYYSHFETEPHLGIRTYKYKLIHFDRIDQWELFDLENDPAEMNNLYEDPDYQSVIKDLKKELKKLQENLGDDPEDHGDYPNIGGLAPKPMHVARDIDLAHRNVSILTRFRSIGGGTLISTGEIEKGIIDWWDEGVNYVALFISQGQLIFFDGEDEFESGIELSDNEWHTLALTIKNAKATLFLDGARISKDLGHIRSEGFPQNFNIGAGMDDAGFSGYNFLGDISHVRIYDRALAENEIQLFTGTEFPQGNTILEWVSTE